MLNKRRKNTIKKRAMKARYQKKDFHNPFFRNKKKIEFNFNFLLSNKNFFYSIIFIFVAILMIWFFCYSSYFQIVNINVNGEGKIEPQEIKKIAERQINKNLFFIMPQSSLTLLNKEKLKERIELKYKFDFIIIDKDFPKTLNISYKEKMHFVTWVEEEIFYEIDENGGVIKEANLLDLKQGVIPLVKNFSTKKINDEKIFLSVEQIKSIKSIFDLLNLHKEEINIEYYFVDDDQKSIKVKVVNGPEVIFNSEKDFEKQIDKLIVLKQNKLKEDFYNKSNINLRIGDSIYYR